MTTEEAELVKTVRSDESATGYKGVGRNGVGYQAQLRVDYNLKNLGVHSTPELAALKVTREMQTRPVPTFLPFGLPFGVNRS